MTVTTAEDDDAVDEEEATLTHTANGGDYDAVTADVVVSITDNDTADVTISKTELTIGEGGSDTYTVVLDSEPTAEVKVAIAGHADTDITLSGDTLADDTLTFTSDNWDTAQTVTVTAAEDDDAASDDAVSLTHTVAGTAEYATVTAGSVTVTITDNDTANVTISKTELTIGEGGSDTYTVVLDSEPTAEVKVAIAGHADTDITLSGDTLADDTLTFTSDNWDTAQTVTVTAAEDDDAASDDAVSLTHTVAGTAEYATVTAESVTVTITDNDTANVTISKTALSIEEGASDTYTVVLDTEPTANVTVAIAGHSGTDITLSGDTLTDDTLTFTSDNWDTAQTVTVSAKEDDDAVNEDEATLTHTVTGTGEYAGVTADSLTINITDNDTANVTISKTALSIEEGASDTYTVVLDSEPTAEVTVAIAGHADTDITLSGATLTNDAMTFTAENWDAAQTVTVTAKEDDDAVDEEEATLTHTVTGTGEYAGVTADSVTVTITDDDTAGVTISESALTIDEGASDTYTVVLDTKPTGDVTVPIAGHAGTDITLTGATLTDDTLTFTSDNWDAAQTVTVTAGEDDDAASDAAVTLTHSANGGGYVDVQETVTVTVVENDASVLSVSNAKAAEDGGNVVFTVSISAASGEEVTVDYATSDGTATAGQDYTETTGTLTFPANSVVSQTVSVPVTDDTVDEEEEETFTLTLSNVQVASLFGDGETLAVTGTINDDDDPAVTASFEQASYSVDEGGTVEVTVTVSADPEREVTILLTHDPQGGATDVDYSGVPENVIFQGGDTEKSFTFRAAGDDIDDDGESVALGFGTMPDDVSAGTTATVTITDDDTAGVTVSKTALEIDEGGSATYTVVLDTEPTGDVTVAIAGHADTDLSLDKTSLTFTADNWDTAQTVTVTAGEDDDAVGEEEATLAHSASGGGYDEVTVDGVRVTITDDDTAGVTVSETALDIDEGGSDTYTVVLDTKPTASVAVTIAGHAGTDITLSGATLTDDTLTFTAENWDAALTVTVTAGEDDDAVSDAAVTLTHTANGGGYIDVQETVTVTILEKDASVLSVGDAEAAEDGGNVVFTVSISAASGEEVTVDYATSDGSATAGQDYTETTGTLTFPANSVVSQTVSVPVTDDTVDEEEEETFTLTLSNVQVASLFGDGETLAVTGTINDDDDPAVTASFEQASYSVDEGGTVEVTVTVSADPEREVTILLTHDPQGGATDVDYSGVPENVIFQSDDTEKSFTFRAAGDDIDDDGESVALGFGTMPDDVSAGTTATVSITDDDTAGVTVSKTALEIDEGGSATYTVEAGHGAHRRRDGRHRGPCRYRPEPGQDQPDLYGGQLGHGPDGNSDDSRGR